MPRTRTAIIAGTAALLAAVFLTTSCGGEQPAGEQGSALNLISMLQAARQFRDTGLFNLDSPLAGYYTAGGWSAPAPLSENGPVAIAAVATKCSLRFSIFHPTDRWLAFRIRIGGEHEDPRGLRLSLLARGELLASFDFDRGADLERMVRIPARLQRVGDNVFLFHFTDTDGNLIVRDHKQKRIDRRRLQKGMRRGKLPPAFAYVSELRLLPGNADGPGPGEPRDENETFRPLRGGRWIGQMPDSALSYIFPIAPGSRLLFSGSVQAPAARESEVIVSVVSRTDDSPKWRELWGRSFSAGSSMKVFEADVDLDSLAGRLAEIRFQVSSPADFLDAVVTWKKIRIERPPARREDSAEPEERAAVRMTGRVHNVVIVTLDAARADHFGCYGDERGMTPRIDEFARESVVFDNAITAAPYTIASMSTFFSGLRPELHGVMRREKETFPAELENMPRAFKRSGYYTVALAGGPFLKNKFGLTSAADRMAYLRSEEAKEQQLSTMDEEEIELAIREAATTGKPAFIFVHLLPPHWPYNPPEPFNRHFTSNPKITRAARELVGSTEEVSADNPNVRKLHLHYMNNLVYADYVTGRLLQMLRRHGLYENSLIIITSDHGEAFGEHGAMGHGSTVYDEMIRVPLIIRVPGVEPRVERQQVGLIDVFPTLAELLDLKLEAAAFQGRSLAPLLAGRQQKPTDYYYSRTSSEQLIFTLRGERYKYIHYPFRELLFDLQDDPLETENIIGKHPVLAAMLRQHGLLMIATAESRRSVEPGEVELTPEEERELRDLGYLQ